jgi:uncharacterized protein YkwD
MRLIALLVFIACFSRVAAAAPVRRADAATTPVHTADLGSHADEITPEAASDLLLRMVNAARRTAGSPEVEWSEPAAALAQAQAEAMAHGHFGAHYDERGWRPELRWNEMGETDFVAENVVYYEIKGTVHLTPELIWQMVQDWINSPDHFANMVDPQHTHLGFGVALVRQFGRTYIAAAQEFVTDLADFDALPVRSDPNTGLDWHGELLSGVELAYIGLAQEPLPRGMSPEELNTSGTPYPLPEVIYSVPEEDIDRNTDGAEVSAKVRLPRDWRDTAVHISVWVTTTEQTDPLCAVAQVVLVN